MTKVKISKRAKNISKFFYFLKNLSQYSTAKNSSICGKDCDKNQGKNTNIKKSIISLEYFISTCIYTTYLNLCNIRHVIGFRGYDRKISQWPPQSLLAAIMYPLIKASNSLGPLNQTLNAKIEIPIIIERIIYD